MSKCNKKGECGKKFDDKAKKPHHGKPTKPANDEAPAKPAKCGGECPSKKDACKP